MLLIFFFLQVTLILALNISIIIRSFYEIITQVSTINLNSKNAVCRMVKLKVNLKLGQLLWWLRCIIRIKLKLLPQTDQSLKKREIQSRISCLVRNLERFLTRKCSVIITLLFKFLQIRNCRVD